MIYQSQRWMHCIGKVKMEKLRLAIDKCKKMQWSPLEIDYVTLSAMNAMPCYILHHAKNDV